MPNPKFRFVVPMNANGNTWNNMYEYQLIQTHHKFWPFLRHSHVTTDHHTDCRHKDVQTYGNCMQLRTQVNGGKPNHYSSNGPIHYIRKQSTFSTREFKSDKFNPFVERSEESVDTQRFGCRDVYCNEKKNWGQATACCIVIISLSGAAIDCMPHFSRISMQPRFNMCFRTSVYVYSICTSVQYFF